MEIVITETDLSETIRIMAEIDKTIESHGGWLAPGNAFITDPEQIKKLER